MARLITTGFEWNSAEAETANPSSFGTGYSTVASPVRSGSYSLLADASADNLRFNIIGATLGRTYYARTYFRMTAASNNSTGATYMFWIGTTGGTPWFGARVNTSEQVEAFDGTSVLGTSAAVNDDTWHRLELRWIIASGNDTLEVKLDGTTLATTTTATVSDSISTMGVALQGVPGCTINFDDFAVNDDQGSDQNSWPGEGKVVLLVPTSDNTVGTGWQKPGGTTTNLYTSIDNKPPVGIADSTSSGDAEKQIRNASSTNAYSANMTTYSAAGITSADTITVLHAHIIHAAPTTTQAKIGSTELVSNPAVTATAFNSTSSRYYAAAAQGTYPTGWWLGEQHIAYNPSVTLGTAPVLRANITSGTAGRIASITAMGINVEYQPPGTVTGTPTANAVIKKTQSGAGQTFTADAVIRRNSGTLTGTADAVVFRTWTGGAALPTADAVILCTWSGAAQTLTADAVIAATIESTFTADAIIALHTEETFPADAVIFRTWAGGATMPAAYAVTLRTWTGGAAPPTADAIILRASGTKTATADAVIFRSSGELTRTADAVVKKTMPGSATADAIVKRTMVFGVGTVGQDSFTGSTADLVGHTAEIGGQWTTLNQWTTAEIVKWRITGGKAYVTGMGSHSEEDGGHVAGLVTLGDGYAQGQFLQSATSGMYSDIQSAPVVRYIATANYYTISDGFFARVTAGAMTVLGSIALGVWQRLQASGLSPTSIKAEIRASEGALGTGWQLQTTDNTAANQTASGGAGIYGWQQANGGGVSSSGDVDNFLAVSLLDGLGPTADALITKTTEVGRTANAVVKKTMPGSATADAVVKKSMSGSVTANAIVKRTREFAAVAVAYDSFNRSGWLQGSEADLGGTWARVNGTLDLTVGDALYGHPSSGSGTTLFRLGTGTVADGNVYGKATITNTDGLGYLGFRLIDASNYYYVKGGNGYDAAGFSLHRRTGGSEYVLGSSGVDNDGTPIKMRASFSGLSPTVLKARWWLAANPEPTSWQIDTTDNTAGNQTASGGYGAYVDLGGGVEGQLDDFTANSNLAADGNGPILNALIRKTAEVSGTADAVVKRTMSGSGTADAVVQREQTGSRTVDAVVRQTMAGSFPADAIIWREQAGSATADAIVRRAASSSVTADAIVKRTWEFGGAGGASVTSYTELGIGGTYDGNTYWGTVADMDSGYVIGVVDAGNVLWDVDTPSSYSVLGQIPSQSTSSLNKISGVNIVGGATPSAGTERAVLWDRDDPTAAPTVLGAPSSSYYDYEALDVHGDFAVGTYRTPSTFLNRPIYWADLTNPTAAPVELDRGGYTKGSAIGVSSTWVLGRLWTTTSVYAVWPRSNLSAAPTILGGSGTANCIDELWIGGRSGSSACIWDASNPTAAPTVLDGASTAEIKAISGNYAVGRSQPSGDSFPTLWDLSQPDPQPIILPHPVWANGYGYGLAVDASRSMAAGHWGYDDWPLLWPIEVGAGTPTADAVIYREQAGSSSADAVLLVPRSATLTADAVVMRITAASLDADAVIAATIEPTFTAGAWIFGSNTYGFPADAVIWREQAGAATADAIVQRSESGSLTADAVVTYVVTGNVTAEAVLQGAQSGSVTADAIVQRSASGSATANATFFKTVRPPWFNNQQGNGYHDAVAYGNGYWVTVGEAGTIRYAVDPHQPTWTLNTQGAANLSAVAYGNGYWVAVGGSGTLWYTTDPTGAWTSNNLTGNLSGVAYGNGYWVAVGSAGIIYYRANDPAGAWTQNNQGASSWSAVAYGNGYWVATGSPNGSLRYRANDPTGSWTTNDQGTGITYRGVAYDNGYWVIVGSAGTLRYRATDPTGAWTSNNRNPSFALGDVAYGDGYWVAVQLTGANNTFYTTDLASAWSVVPNGTIGFSGVAYAGGLWVAVGNGSNGTGSVYIAETPAGGGVYARFIIKRNQTGSTSVDAVLAKTQVGSFSVDAVSLVGQANTFDAQAIVFARQTSEYTADAVFLAGSTGVLSIDAIVQAQQSGSVAADAWIFIPSVEQSITADAIISREQAGSLTASAWVQGAGVSGFAVDAIVQSTLSESYSTDAVLRASRSGTFTANAVIRATASSSTDFEAVISKTAQAALTASAVVRAPRTVGVTAEAVLTSPRTGSVGADAVIAGLTGTSFPARAVILGYQSGSFTASAVLGIGRSDSLTADAYLLASSTKSFSAAAIVIGAVGGSFVTGAVLSGESVHSLSAAAVLRRASSNAFTSDAIVRRSAPGSFSIDAFLRFTGGSFTADALLRGLSEFTFGAAAVITVRRSKRIRARVTADQINATLFVASIHSALIPIRTISATIMEETVVVQSFSAGAVIV